ADRIGSSGRVVVVDAATEDDLRRLAGAIALLGSKAVPVGSAGLARHLARTWKDGSPAAPAIVIVTSLQEMARLQATELENDGAFRYEPAPGDFSHERAWARSWASILE